MSREKHLEAMLDNAEKEIEDLNAIIEMIALSEIIAQSSIGGGVPVNFIRRLKDVDEKLFYFIADKFRSAYASEE